MASPQKEKGYTPIANEIMDALAKTRMPGEARQVLCVVLRNTYGWNRKKARLSMGFIATATGLKRPNVARALKNLVSHSIISVISQDNTKGNFWQFNKDFSKWIPFIYGRRVINQDNTAVISQDNASVISQDTQQRKDNKTKINKTTPSSRTTGFKDEVSLIFEPFYETINPTINFGRADSRNAAEFLIKKFGYESTRKAAEYACSVFLEKYAPQITTPAQLKDKWSLLVKFKNLENSKGKEAVYDE